MTTSPISPRASLVARSRKHFAAIAATGILMTGALTACAANDDDPSSTSRTDGTTSSDTGTASTDTSTGTSTDTSPDSGSSTSSGSGVTSPDTGSSSSDGTTAAS